jgi:hypothetical protein
MPELSEQIAAAAAQYPQASGLASELMQRARMLFAGQFEHQVRRHGDAFWQQAERLVGYSRALGGDPTLALLEYTHEYLKEQARYLKTGEYSNSDFDEVLRNVYDNPEVMQKFYLDGLMLTHAVWPIHFDMHHFFESEFLTRVPDAGSGVEYGFGHGLYLLEILTNRPNTRARGFDISSYSVDFAGRLLTHGQVESSRFDLGLADVRRPFDVPDGTFSWAVFAEIIEHIPDPKFSLTELRRTMISGAPLFATTVLFSNALDHIYQFKDTDEVRALLRSTGFEIVSERVLSVRDYDSKARDPSVDIALVCVAS